MAESSPETFARIVSEALHKDTVDRRVIARLIGDDGTLATVLQIICLTLYGEEIYQVDPLEIISRLEEDCGTRVTDHNENRLKAMFLATSTEAFYDEPEAFYAIGNTLLNGDPGIDEMDPLTIPELSWAIYEVALNHGDRDFTPSVQTLVDAVMQGEMTDSSGTAIAEEPNDYIWAFLRKMHSRLEHQLKELGVPSEYLPRIELPDMASISE